MRFNSRPHEEVDQQVDIPHLLSQRFNSRPHEEVDIQVVLLLKLLTRFNSRPHEEVDLSQRVFGGKNNVSTHDLTRRSTFLIFSSPYSSYVSTHDLTRRSTEKPFKAVVFIACFNSRPHEEVDGSYLP